MKFPKQISLEIDSRNPHFAARQNEMQIKIADNIYFFAENAMKDLDEDFDKTAFKWSSNMLCDSYGNVHTEELHQLYYKGVEILSYTKVSDIETIIYTSSISLYFLELLRQKGVKSLDNLLDSI